MDDGATIATLIAFAMGLVKILEKMITWAMTKVSKKDEKPTFVQFSPQAEAAIIEILRKTDSIHTIVNKTDNDGIPLVYFPRSVSEKIENIDDSVGLMSARYKNGSR